MPGKGKYTEYVPSTPNRKTRAQNLARLFPGNPSVKGGTPPFYGDTAGTILEQDLAAARLANYGNKYIYGFDETGAYAGPIKGNSTVGDFNPNFTGPDGKSIPNKWSTSASDDVGNWQKSGDPANPYVPDLTSPAGGPGTPGDNTLDISPIVANVSPYNKQDPKITVESVKPGFKLDSSENTKNPSIEANNIHSNVKLGSDMEMGKSYPKNQTLL